MRQRGRELATHLHMQRLKKMKSLIAMAAKAFLSGWLKRLLLLFKVYSLEMATHPTPYAKAKKRNPSYPAFPLTPKRTFLRSKNLLNTSRIFGLGVRKIPDFGCIRPFVFSRTYMNAQQALRLIKYYFVCMKISRPVEAGCLGSRRILTYFHSYRRAREKISWHNVCPPKARSAAFTL